MMVPDARQCRAVCLKYNGSNDNGQNRAYQTCYFAGSCRPRWNGHCSLPDGQLGQVAGHMPVSPLYDAQRFGFIRIGRLLIGFPDPRDL